MKKLYLDYAATTPTDPRVIKVMLPYFCKLSGNASSLHEAGQIARKDMNKAREAVAQTIKAESEEIVFTSGGSEADNLAIKGVFYSLYHQHPHIITSKIEHHAVLHTCQFLEKQGAEVTYLPVDKYGIVNVIKLKQAIKDETVLISIMHANNEIGTIQPINEIGQIIKAEKEKRIKKKDFLPIYFHTDAVQTFGHIPVNVNDLNVDFLSASAHKLYGPKGVGMLYVKKGIKIESLIHGGEHEKGRRASTENIPGIIGFAKAVELADQEMEKENKRLITLRDYLIKKVLDNINGSHLNGHPEMRLANNINVSLEGIEGESMLIELDAFGIYCSTGSACSSATLEPSHVLMAMHLRPEVAHASLRFSLGRWTEKSDLDYVFKKLIMIVNRLRGISPLKVK